jgi:hypothetical protein
MDSSLLSRSVSSRNCMHPSPLLTDAFRAAATRILLVNGEKSYRGADLLTRFEKVSQALAGHSGSCAICASSEPEDVLTSLCLPAEIGVSVLFVPEYLSREVPALAETVGASASSNESARPAVLATRFSYSRLEPAANRRSSATNGRLFLRAFVFPSRKTRKSGC